MADLSPNLQELFGMRFLPGYWTNAYGGYTSPWQFSGGPYDPNKFIPQGRPAATPDANPDVARQSQVIRTQEEVSQEMQRLAEISQMRQQRQVDRTNAYYEAQKPTQAIIDAYRKSSPNDITQAIQDVMGGQQTAITLGPNGKGSGNYIGWAGTAPDGSIPVPQEYQPTTGGAQNYTVSDPFSPNPTRQLKGADAFARDTSSDIVSAIRSGQAPVIPENLQGIQGISDAVTKFQDAYTAYQALPGGVRTRPPGTTQEQSLGRINQREDQFRSGLQNSFTSFQDQARNNWQTQNQAYLDMTGGGFGGGVLPNSLNPQWYDTTPTFFGNDSISGQSAQHAAQNSPWGQAGAPFAAQSWAAGGPQGPQQVQQSQGGWSGAPNAFAPMNASASLSTNAPWFQPQQQNSNKMTFGSSPWGSFW